MSKYGNLLTKLLDGEVSVATSVKPETIRRELYRQIKQFHGVNESLGMEPIVIGVPVVSVAGRTDEGTPILKIKLKKPEDSGFTFL